MTNRPGATKLGCLFTVLLVAATLYFGIPAGETYFRYLKFKDAMKQELRFRSNLPDHQIRRNLKIAADSLGLPSEAGDVIITRAGGQITAEADYEEVIHLPGTQRAIRFRPTAKDTY